MSLDRGIRMPTVAVMVTLCLGMVLVSGCFLSPREQESPSSGEQIDYVNDNSAVNVWTNLEISLNNTHAPGWETRISDDFQYTPDSQALNMPGLPPGYWENWNKERESAFINNLYDNVVGIISLMRDPDFVVPDESGGVAEWEGVIYDLTVDSGGSVIRYRASADISFRLEGNFWYVYRWIDLIGESDPETGQTLSSMGVLRGTFGSN